MANPVESMDVEADERIVELVDDYGRAVQEGRVADVESFIAQHPQYADRLRRLLPTIDILADLATPQTEGGIFAESQDGSLAATTLGDFRILRQIGRGGMGVVYEAQQLSLGRRVALKVLPFAAALDARQLQRFKNEAQAAAHLHHTHIVPVFAVGCERGVHYYAMQLIEGESLAAVIEELAAWHRPEQHGEMSTHRSDVPNRQSDARPPAAVAGIDSRSPSSSTLFGRSPPDRTTRTSSFFRTVAELGIQAAQALQYAHELGVVHRDIKPANLLIDVRGHLWITDFGLAHMQSETRLTMTGDLMGTLRYMSPEQALSRHDVLDHRTDLYSLGVTLYEFITLAPVFAGRDRQELLRQIALDEPRPPRRLNPAIPVELETILLKTLAKAPQERYTSAKELAEDLQRFLRDEPIRARRPTVSHRVVKWTRRHRAIVWTAAVCGVLATAVVAALLGWVAHDRQTRRILVEHETTLALNEAEGMARLARWPEATEAARRAAGLLSGVDADQPLHGRCEQISKDLRFVARVEEVRFARSEGANSGWTVGLVNYGRAIDEYAKVFREFDLDVERMAADETQKRLAGRTIHVSVAAALDDWALSRLALDPKDSSWQRLLALARAIDEDSPRTEVRLAVERRDKSELLRQARVARTEDLPPQTALLLAAALAQRNEVREAASLLSYVQRRHANDFWINYMLAWYLRRGLLSDEAALPYATAAAALRPKSAAAQHMLADALYNVERPEEAILAARQSLSIQPDYVPALMTLSEALRGIGRHSEALVAARKALELRANEPLALLNLAKTLALAGKHEEAIAAYRQAIQANPDFTSVHSDLGFVLAMTGRIDEAIAEYREAIRRNPRDSAHHQRLADALVRSGRIEEAVAEQRKAVELRPHDPEMRGGLAGVLFIDRKWGEAIRTLVDALRVFFDTSLRNIYTGQYHYDRGLFHEAAQYWRLALRSYPNNADLHARLAKALYQVGQFSEAAECYRTAIRLAPGEYPYHAELGSTLLRLERTGEALAAAQEALRIKPAGARGGILLGEVLCRRGKWSEGIASLRKVVKAHPENREAPGILAQMLRDRARAILDADANNSGQQFDEALEWAREACQLQPTQSDYWTILGIVHCRRSEWPDARSALEKAIAGRGSSPTALERFWLTVALSGQGDKVAAKSSYDQALHELQSMPARTDDARMKSARAAAERALPPQ